MDNNKKTQDKPKNVVIFVFFHAILLNIVTDNSVHNKIARSYSSAFSCPIPDKMQSIEIAMQSHPNN